ncbi:hypothetical protein [Flammeovirga sp. EKP202]|uniref:hypothetical protein n=1 Tax=Flammeovirga sp. EKP202 TaxID=2770592 RepID=UPI00165EFA12|nr:hypothetical protein [Flammeovirga sp. EKP202]MBD0402368.1 hypothetical protein [Flammeovirga sp. EKP202]
MNKLNNLLLLFIGSLFFSCGLSEEESIAPEPEVKLPKGLYPIHITHSTSGQTTKDIEVGYNSTNGHLTKVISYEYKDQIMLPDTDRLPLAQVVIDSFIYVNDTVRTVINETLSEIDYYGLQDGVILKKEIIDTDSSFSLLTKNQLYNNNTLQINTLESTGRIKGRWLTASYDLESDSIENYLQFSLYIWENYNIIQEKVYRGNGSKPTIDETTLIYWINYTYDDKNNPYDIIDFHVINCSLFPSTHFLPKTKNNITSRELVWNFPNSTPEKSTQTYEYNELGYPIEINSSSFEENKKVTIEYHIEN